MGQPLKLTESWSTSSISSSRSGGNQSATTLVQGFVNQAEAAGIFVEAGVAIPWCAHPVQTKSFYFGMPLSPFGERPPDAALVRHIELRGETADIVQKEKATRRQRTVPEVQFSQSRLDIRASCR